jgi:hypothetical protein
MATTRIFRTAWLLVLVAWYSADARANTVARPSPVITVRDTHLTTWLQGKFDVLDRRAGQLDVIILKNKLNCESVDEDDAARRASCAVESKIIEREWNNYSRDHNEYQRQREAVILLDQYWSAVQGLYYNAQAFTNRAAALGGNTAREHPIIAAGFVTVIGALLAQVDAAAAISSPSKKLAESITRLSLKTMSGTTLQQTPWIIYLLAKYPD